MKTTVGLGLFEDGGLLKDGRLLEGRRMNFEGDEVILLRCGFERQASFKLARSSKEMKLSSRSC
jgi:hypothetical protein